MFAELSFEWSSTASSCQFLWFWFMIESKQAFRYFSASLKGNIILTLMSLVF